MLNPELRIVYRDKKLEKDLQNFASNINLETELVFKEYNKEKDDKFIEGEPVVGGIGSPDGVLLYNILDNAVTFIFSKEGVQAIANTIVVKLIANSIVKHFGGLWNRETFAFVTDRHSISDSKLTIIFSFYVNIRPDDFQKAWDEMIMIRERVIKLSEKVDFSDYKVICFGYSRGNWHGYWCEEEAEVRDRIGGRGKLYKLFSYVKQIFSSRS